MILAIVRAFYGETIMAFPCDSMETALAKLLRVATNVPNTIYAIETVDGNVLYSVTVPFQQD